MLKCKTPKQMRLENSLGYPPNFAAVINQEYCDVSPYRTWTNCSFKHFSGRHKSVFMATSGRYRGRLANMKIKSSLGYHPAMLSCVKSQMERTTVWWHSSLTKHCLGSAFYIPSTACYWSRCFVFIPVFSPVMNFICLVLHINDMFQFNVTYSLSYITQCQDLRPQKILFLHLADVGLISFTDI